MNRTVFFTQIRGSLFGGGMTQEQVDGVNIILDAFEGQDIHWTAYALATAHHETAKTMQPIKEFGGTAYYTRMYDVRGKDPERARKYGNTTPGDGARYCGRGFVQLTWKVNYEKAAKAVSAPLVTQPDLAMKPDIAALIMLRGMKEGWFTGKKLSDYFNDKIKDWRNARKIINGLDQADMIASYGRMYYAALIAARNAADAPAKPPKPAPAPKEMQSDPVEPDAPVAPPEAPKADAPWWEKSPVVRSVMQLGAWVAAGGSALLAADWKVIAVLAAFGTVIAIFALRYQTRKV